MGKSRKISNNIIANCARFCSCTLLIYVVQMNMVTKVYNTLSGGNYTEREMVSQPEGVQDEQ